MRAVVVYESMYGNTQKVADAIAVGLGQACDVRVVPVSRLGTAALADVDLVVVGGSTHAQEAGRPASMSWAVRAAKHPVSGLRTEPGELGPGLSDWFRSLGHYHARAAAFDTRMSGQAAPTGRAWRTVKRLLRAHGFEVIAEPESFLVTRQDLPDPGEMGRAREWGARLACAAAPRSRR